MRFRSFMNACSSFLLLCALVGAEGCGDSSRSSPGPAKPAPAAGPSNRPKGRLVVLGFDGVDPRWLERWAAEGKLPNLKRLMEANGRAGYRHLASTNPPQSPVAWTTFATGTPPGDHGVYDFIARKLRREPGGLPVMPQIATTSFEPQRAGPPLARNLRTGEPFWQTLGNAGVRVVALNVPYSFPPDPMRDGRMLSGLGTPDLRETNSTFTYAGSEVTPEDAARPPGGGVLVPLRLEGGVGRFDLAGPSSQAEEGGRAKIAVEARINATRDGLDLTFGEARVSAKVGEMSGFVEVTFSDAGRSIKGVLKVLALEAAPRMRLFITPISIHPRDPYSPIAYPSRFSGELAEDLGGVYKTVGWDHDTSALSAEVIDDGAFLAEMNAIELQRKQMLLARLGRDDWQMLIWVSTATDRVAHMFYRLIDPEHPRYDAALAARHGDAILREYERMDATLGEVLAKLRADDTLLVISDHGFHNYRRGLHVNQWLRSEGLLALRDDATSTTRELLLDIDWSRTKAYALGTGQIYINQRGREREGIVAPEDAPALLRQIRDGLVALRDTAKNDAVVVRQVYLGSEVFRGGRAADAPDAQIAFAENYRTSWETILGGVPADLFADNDKKWSGDHAASDVAETPGILVSNRAITRAEVGIVDLAPTSLSFFGQTLPPRYTGSSFLAPRP